MTLTGSGQISFNDIRVELNVPSQSPFSISQAATDGYAYINRCTGVYPSPSAPFAISSWYGYNHSDTGSLFYTLTGPEANSIDACLLSPAASVLVYTRDQIEFYADTGDGFTARTCRGSGPSAGYYLIDGSSPSEWAEFSGLSLVATGSCTTTTTTTTTTAACLPNGQPCTNPTQCCSMFCDVGITDVCIDP